MEPIIDKNIKILILGTYLGDEAIKNQEYYFPETTVARRRL